MIKIAGIICIGILSMGCQEVTEHHPCHGSFYIDNSNGLMTDTMRNQILAGADKWNTFLGENYFHIDESGICPIYVDPHMSKNLGTYAWENNHASIKLAFKLKDYSPDYVAGIVAHELGHSENLQHISSSGIMSTDHFVTKFTIADDTECRKVGFCN